MGANMIHTTFRVRVTTAEPEEDDLLDTATLLSVFKCASATHEVAANFGLPDEGEGLALGTDDGSNGKTDNALLQTARTIDSARAVIADAKEKGRAIGIPNRQGRLITPEALDIYRETFVMRRSFGMPNTERTNIDASSKKLPKILPEDVSRYFPIPSAEQLAQAMTARPKTKPRQMEEALCAYPQPLPSLGLRISILHRPLWDRDDEVARRNWKKIVRPQLSECLHELQKDLLRLEVPSNVGADVKEALRFSRLDLRFDNCILSVANESTNRIGNVEEALDTFYALLNDGAFGDREVIRIDAPFIDYGAVRSQNEERKKRFLEKQAQARTQAEEAARLQAEREEQWQRDAERAQEAIDGAEQSAREELAEETTQPDALRNACADEHPVADRGKVEDDEQATVAGEPGSAEDADTAENAGGCEQDDEPSHYQGAAALRFSEETVYQARCNEWADARRREEAEAVRESERKKAVEEGGIWLPELRERVWGVFFSDGSSAYIDSATGRFCDAPEQGDDDEEGVADAAGDGGDVADIAARKAQEAAYA